MREWRYTVGLPPGAVQVGTGATVDIPLEQEAHVTPVLGYRLTMHLAGDGAIHFGDPGTVYDTSPVVMDFPPSEAVNVYAVPGAGSAFVHWLGDASGATNPLALTMTEDKELTAVFTTPFATDDVNLNVTVHGEGEIAVNAVPMTDSHRFVFDAHEVWDLRHRVNISGCARNASKQRDVASTSLLLWRFPLL